MKNILNQCELLHNFERVHFVIIEITLKKNGRTCMFDNIELGNKKITNLVNLANNDSLEPMKLKNGAGGWM